MPLQSAASARRVPRPRNSPADRGKGSPRACAKPSRMAIHIAPRIRNATFDAWAHPAGLLAVYLFGSTARGSDREDSDVDVGLTLKTPLTDGIEEERLREEAVPHLAAALGVPPGRLDVVVLDSAPLAFKYCVLACRRLLWESDARARIRREVDITREYVDFRYYEEKYVQRMRQRIREGSYGRRPFPRRSAPR